jgi:hypothetical protein
MRYKEQLLAHFHRLHQHNQELTQALEKYRQETEYACLKTGIADWPAFLTALRTGRVAAVGQKTVGETDGPAMALLNGLFENASTARAHRFCECESPVFSEGSIHHPKGGDTSRSESEDPSHSPPPEQTIHCILQEIEKYEQERAQPLQGFDTFRKPDREETLNETAAQVDSTEKSVQSTGRHLEQTAKMEHPFQPVWRRGQAQPVEVQEWRPSPSPNEFTLALENTRLRKQLR